jgi:hypothetical protein
MSENKEAFSEWVESKTDMINNPPHYNKGKIECIKYLEDNLGEGYSYYLEGNIKKYLHRWRYKEAPVEDLRKAAWYLGKLIESQVFSKPE